MRRPRRKQASFLSGAVAVAGAYIANGLTPASANEADTPRLPLDFGPCPRDLHDFLKYIVQRRAAEGLNAIILSEQDPRFQQGRGKQKPQVGTVYGGAVEDANVASTAAAAYRYPWSRFHRNEALRNRAFLLLDGIARVRASGQWDEGGLDGFLARTALPGQFSPGWRRAMQTRRGPPSGVKPSSRPRAARALRRYDDWLFSGGGVAYFLMAACEWISPASIRQVVFLFKPEQITEPPREAWTPLLLRSAPASDRDYAHVATLVRPAAAEGSVEVKSLAHGAAVVLLEPDARKAYVWVVNLHRQMQQYLLDLPTGTRVRTYKRDVELPSVPPAEPANACLMGAEGTGWVLQSESPLNAKALLNGLKAGKSR